MRRFKYLALAAAAAVTMPAMAADFSFTGPIAIPDNFTGAGPAATFPITFNVSGLGSQITDINLTLTGLKHSFADDLVVALQGPNGLAILLMSDAGGSANFNTVNLTFNQQAAAALADSFGSTNANIPGGSYKPSTYGFNPFQNLVTSGNNLDSFNGLNPNGTWKLWIADDSFGNFGSLQGATLSIAAVPEPATWAMMLGGFAIVGSAMRRRKVAVSFA